MTDCTMCWRGWCLATPEQPPSRISPIKVQRSLMLTVIIRPWAQRLLYCLLGKKEFRFFFKTLYSPLPCHFCNQFLPVNGPHFFMKLHIFSKCQRETILFCNSAKTRVCLNQHAKVLGFGNDPIRRYACHMYLYTQPCSVGQMPGSGHFCVFSFTPSLEVPEILQAVFYTMEVKVNK